MLLYTKTVKGIVTKVSKDIEGFVILEQQRFDAMKQIPLILMIGLAIFIPVVAYVTLQATSSMFKYVKYYRKLKIIKIIIFHTIFHFTITKYFNTYFRFSDLYDERVETYRKEKKKTEKLLTDLLPRSVIRKMKRVCSSMIYYW